MSRVLPRCQVGPCLRPNDATALLYVHYRRFNARTGDSVADRRIDIPPRGFATCRFSTHRLSTFTCSVGEPELRSCRLYTGCRWVDLQIPLPALPAGSQYPTVLTASLEFRCVFGRFTCVHLLSSYLPASRADFCSSRSLPWPFGPQQHCLV
jgi:hypothetical protein